MDQKDQGNAARISIVVPLLDEAENLPSLYQQIMYYLDNPEARLIIAEKGKQKADTMFDNDEHFKKLEAVLTEVATL